MFMHTNGRCGGCEKVFCCSQHRRAHQLGCEPFQSKPTTGSMKKPKINQTSMAHDQFSSPLITNARMKNLLTREKKRKHDHSGSPFPRASGSSPYRFLIPTDRKFKRAVRGKFRKVQKIPTLEPVKEEDEEDVDQTDSITQGGIITRPNIYLNETKPIICDPYNDFIVGSLKDSPITIMPTVSPEKCKDIIVTPTTSSGVTNKMSDIFKTSTPDNISHSVNYNAGRTPLSKIVFGYKTHHAGVNLTASTPKDSEQSCGAKANESQAGYIESSEITPPIKTQPALCTPVDSQARKQQRFIRSISSLGSSGSSLYYSACSIISPLALNSHPCTPDTNPSLFTSVKDVFRTFISRLPGAASSEYAQGRTPIDSLTIDSPARKRMKKLAESRIQCRPTYKGRYKQSPSYTFNR